MKRQHPKWVLAFYGLNKSSIFKLKKMTSTTAPTTLKSMIRLQPNPVTNFLQIAGFEGTASILISDFNCIPLLKKQITADETIAVDKLKKGVYIVKIITATETIERKLVKE